MLSYHYRIPLPSQQRPSYPIPYPNHKGTESKNQTSQIFESSPDFPIYYFNAMQRANCELFMILQEVATIYLTEEMHSTFPDAGTVTSFHNRLLRWHEHLPSILVPDASVLPQHLFFQ